MKAKKWLQETPVSEFDELLTKGSMPDTHRPTLFDFVVYDALRFYTAGEQAGAAAQDAYVLQATSPVLGPPERLRGVEDRVDRYAQSHHQSHSPVPAADGFSQELKTTIQRWPKPILSRLQFGYNQSFGEDKNARYKAALTGFTSHWKDAPISARALAAHAQVLHGEAATWLTPTNWLSRAGKRFPTVSAASSVTT